MTPFIVTEDGLNYVEQKLQFRKNADIVTSVFSGNNSDLGTPSHNPLSPSNLGGKLFPKIIIFKFIQTCDYLHNGSICI